jgi:hypothetical protein
MLGASPTIWRSGEATSASETNPKATSHHHTPLRLDGSAAKQPGQSHRCIPSAAGSHRALLMASRGVASHLHANPQNPVPTGALRQQADRHGQRPRPPTVLGLDRAAQWALEGSADAIGCRGSQNKDPSSQASQRVMAKNRGSLSSNLPETEPLGRWLGLITRDANQLSVQAAEMNAIPWPSSAITPGKYQQH